MHPPARKLWDVSGAVHPHHKIADSLRLLALFVHSSHEILETPQAFRAAVMKIPDSCRLCAHPPHENCETFEVLCSPMMQVANSLRLCAPPPFTKLWDVSGCLHLLHRFAASLRLWALFVLCSHQNWGASQALCTPMMKIADSLRLCAPPPHENWGTSQALCSPMRETL